MPAQFRVASIRLISFVSVVWALIRIGWLGAVAAAAPPAASASPADLDHFERRVRPVLAANCYGCHGAKKAEGGLRLDSRAAILTGGERGPAAGLERPETSLLLAAVRQQGDVQMPPEGRLRDDEIRALEKWLKAGLPWPAGLPTGDDANAVAARHWAFQPVTRPAIPERDADSWECTPIDRFVLQQLDQVQLPPSSAVDRRTLLRRLSFDLCGLPPTPDQIAEFAADPNPDATERLVDRLLAAPQFGERWARFWLDLARYADNKGYVFFEEKSYPWAYTYRDYVVEAFNADVPYDRFVMEQIAADRLPGTEPRTWTATGFLTVGGHFMNNTHDIIDDRIDVLTRGLLGLTVTCARCHDHKYDPIPQADYYSLYGVLRSCYEPTVPPVIGTPPDNESSHKFAAELEDREQRLVSFVTQKHSQLVRDARTRVREYLAAAHAQRGKPATDNFMLLVDEGDLNPTMILRWQVYLEHPQREQERFWAAWLALADLSPDQFREQALPRWRTAQSSAVGVHPQLAAALEAKFPESFSELIELYARLLTSAAQDWEGELARAAVAKQTPPARFEDAAAEELRHVLYGHDAPPSVPLAMDWGFLSLFPDRPTQGKYQKLLKDLETWMISGPDAPPRAMALLDSEVPHEPRVFLRGNPNRAGAPVPRQFLQVAQPTRQPYRAGSGRLEVAQAIVAPENPLTARVIVNRLWQQHFGQGLVRTPGDFGLRCEPPTHPELLDWLAANLRSPDGAARVADEPNAWSLKRLHRLMVLSRVYQQSSRQRPEVSTADPENRWLAVAPIRRLEFEQLRDAILAVSGELDCTLGGRSLPLWDGWTPRRTLYGVIDRLDTPSLLSTFDFPSPLVSSPARAETTVPPQALFLMNNGLLDQAARHVLRRPDVQHQTDPNRRVESLYRICFARTPTAAELAASLQYLGDRPHDERWSSYIHGLMMTNEFFYLD